MPSTQSPFHLILPDGFGDPMLLWGVLLAGLPLVLFLLERRRARTIDWPAMQFLLRRGQRRVRWLQAGELLLLAVRTLVIAAFAYALARPLTNSGTSPMAASRGGRGALILVDNTLSMHWRPQADGSETLFDAARKTAVRIVEERHADGDPLWILPLVERPGRRPPSPFRTRRDAIDAIGKLSVEPVAGVVLDGLDRAAELLRSSAGSEWDLQVITDLQASSWSLDASADWRFVLERLRALTPAPILFAVSPVESRDRPYNHAITSLASARELVGTRRSVDLIAEIRATGDLEDRAVPLTVRVDGTVRATREITLSTSRTARVRVPCQFERPGAHRVAVSLATDRLEDDDTRYLAIEVTDRVPVLILVGDRNPGPRGSRGDLVELALAPRAGEEVARDVLFRPQIVNYRDLENEKTLRSRLRSGDRAQSPRVIVLANVPDLPPDVFSVMEDFVRGGGGLLIFAGDRVRPAAYNRALHVDGRGILPGRLGARRSAPPGAPAHPRAFRLDHAAFAPLDEDLQSAMEEIEILEWTEITPSTSSATVLARIGDSPLVVEKSFGGGKVVLFAIAAEKDDTDLVQRPIFLPMIHGLIGHLATRSSARRDVSCGDMLRPRIDLRPGESSPPHVSVRYPDGSLAALPVRPTALGFGVEIEALSPGFYEVTVRHGDDGEETTLLRSASPSSDDSDLERLDGTALRILREGFGFTLETGESTTAVGSASTASRVQQWPLVLAFVLALLVAETALGRYLDRGRAPPSK